MKKYSYILFLFLLVSVSFGQEIYFCNSHTQDGEPIDARNVWAIKPWGSLIYILYDNNDKPLGTQLNYMFVDRYVDGSYKPFDSKAINVKKGATWFAYNYKFTEPGKYKVYFVNQNKKELASETVTIQLESDYHNSRKQATSIYYDGARVKFCERIIAGQLINEFNTRAMNGTDSLEVYVYVKNSQPLKTDIIEVNIWQKASRSPEYDNFVETKKYQIKPEWDYAFFTYYFTSPGQYKFDIYNQNEILISSGYIRIKE